MDLDIQSYSLGHLGIVAGIFDALKIEEVIDGVMPKQGSKNLPHSTIIKDMISMHSDRPFNHPHISVGSRTPKILPSVSLQ